MYSTRMCGSGGLAAAAASPGLGEVASSGSTSSSTEGLPGIIIGDKPLWKKKKSVGKFTRHTRCAQVEDEHVKLEDGTPLRLWLHSNGRGITLLTDSSNNTVWQIQDIDEHLTGRDR